MASAWHGNATAPSSHLMHKLSIFLSPFQSRTDRSRRMSWEVGPEIQKIILVGAVMVEREKNFDGERRGEKNLKGKEHMYVWIQVVLEPSSEAPLIPARLEACVWFILWTTKCTWLTVSDLQRIRIRAFEFSKKHFYSSVCSLIYHWHDCVQDAWVLKSCLYFLAVFLVVLHRALTVSKKTPRT